MTALLRPLAALLDLLAFGLVRGIIGLIEILPDGAAMVVCRGCIWLLRLAMPRSSGVGRRNLELIFPDKPVAERERILKDSYEILARHLLAFARASRLTKERAAEMYDYREIRPVWEKTRATAPEGVGCIIVTVHYGSFELLHHAHALQDRPLAVLSRPMRSPRLERFFKLRREMFGNQQFSRDGGHSEMMKFLRSGKDVLIVMDQNVKRNHAVFVDFFGIPAATTKTIALASIRTGAPIFFATAAEVSPWKFKMIFAPIGRPDDFSGTNTEKVEFITRAIHREFERAIVEHPEQWMWIHRRFKTRPEGEVENLYR